MCFALNNFLVILNKTQNGAGIERRKCLNWSLTMLIGLFRILKEQVLRFLLLKMFSFRKLENVWRNFWLKISKNFSFFFPFLDLSFKFVLFFYSRKNQIVLDALKGLWGSYVEDKQKSSPGLPDVNFSDLSSGQQFFDEDNLKPFVEYYDWLMSLDRKLGSLKTIQGMIWKNGYENGSIKGQWVSPSQSLSFPYNSFLFSCSVYPEVPECFENWSKTTKIAIYSSGSVQAQKLLFSNTEYGDLTCYLEDYFDTINAGPKNDSKSYEKILNKLQTTAEKTLFLTDSLQG